MKQETCCLSAVQQLGQTPRKASTAVRSYSSSSRKAANATEPPISSLSHIAASRFASCRSKTPKLERRIHWSNSRHARCWERASIDLRILPFKEDCHFTAGCVNRRGDCLLGKAFFIIDMLAARFSRPNGKWLEEVASMAVYLQLVMWIRAVRVPSQPQKDFHPSSELDCCLP